MRRTLFVCSQYMINSVAGFVQLIINIYNGAAGITENIRYTLLYQGFDNDLSSCHLHKKLSFAYIDSPDLFFAV